MRSRKREELVKKDVYKKYLKDGVNSLSTKELLELLEILYALGKNYEVIEVAEYTLSLIDMGMSNDFIDEELNEWLNKGFGAEDYDDRKCHEFRQKLHP
jgi:DNA repair protein RadC